MENEKNKRVLIIEDEKSYAMVEAMLIEEIGFEGSGCAISKASASLMTTTVKGKTKAEVDKLF